MNIGFKKIAVLGNGISAGLLTYILSPNHNITVFRSTTHLFSPIPEIVPADSFFNLLGIDKYDRKKFIEYTKCHLNHAILNTDSTSNKVDIFSNDEYYIYDKSKLADYLLSISEVKDIVFQTIENIRELDSYDLIFDCRGRKSILDDPNYSTKTITHALTKCSYLIIENKEYHPKDTMVFWSKNSLLPFDNTLFAIPINNNKISIGCSYNPNYSVQKQELLDIALKHEIHIPENQIIHSGEVMPNISKSLINLKNIIPIGESNESSCPLTEYGVLKSLNQIYKTLDPHFKPISIVRNLNRQRIDPHIPMELFS